MSKQIRLGKIYINVNVLDEVKKFQVLQTHSLSVVDYISASWTWLESRCNLRYPKLQKLSIIFDDNICEIPVVNGTPDRAAWIYFVSGNNHKGNLLFLKKWAAIVATLEDDVIGFLYVSPTLIE